MKRNKKIVGLTRPEMNNNELAMLMIKKQIFRARKHQLVKDWIKLQKSEDGPKN
jgi:hypothetical protein